MSALPKSEIFPLRYTNTHIYPHKTMHIHVWGNFKKMFIFSAHSCPSTPRFCFLKKQRASGRGLLAAYKQELGRWSMLLFPTFSFRGSLFWYIGTNLHSMAQAYENHLFNSDYHLLWAELSQAQGKKWFFQRWGKGEIPQISRTTLGHR